MCQQHDVSYAISVTGTQLIFNGTTFNRSGAPSFSETAPTSRSATFWTTHLDGEDPVLPNFVNRERVNVNEENRYIFWKLS